MLTPQQIARNSLARAGYVLNEHQAKLHTNLVPDIPWQLEALEDQSYTVLLTGSAGGGKSRVGLEMLHRYLQRNPGATGLMMRKAREWAEKSIAPFMRQTVIGQSGRHIAIHKKADKLFEYANGSTLYYGGMKDDDQRESIRSIGGDGGLDIALFEEANAFTEDDYNEIIGRVRNTAGAYRQIILMTNPDAPTHWINRRLIIGQEAKVFYSSALDNPHNAPEYVENLNKMTGLLYDRLVLGKWVQAEGVIYDNFSVEHNVTDEAEYNADWRVVWGVDDGYVRGRGPGTESYHPRVILFANITPTGAVHVFDEYVACEELSEVSLQNAVERPYKRPDIAYIDSSASEIKARLTGMGITNTGATHTVSEGIKNVRRFICDHNNQRMLKVHPRCTHLIREMASYRYDDKSKIAQVGEPKPLKIDDHSCDSLRYLMWHLRYQG
jgi:PBSX family phage terminase large subunit